MPPKKSSKKKKKKETAPPLVRPEAPGADELEVAMLWDRIKSQKPNPMQPPGHLVYSFSTLDVTNSGPLPKEVVGMDSATVPKIATAPVVSSPQTGTRPKTEKDEKRGGTASSTTKEGKDGTPSGAVESNMATFVHPPTAPRRHAGFLGSARAVNRLHDAEKRAKEFAVKKAHLKECEDDMANVIRYDRVDFKEQKEDFRCQIEVLEELRQNTMAKHTEDMDRQKMHFETLKFRLGEELSALHDDKPRVDGELLEKKTLLTKKEHLEKEFAALQIRHSEHLKSTQHDLENRNLNTKNTMISRLQQTTDDMKKLTEEQREMRQQRAVAESAKLVSDLTALERTSKKLNATNSKYVNKAEVTARDRTLEADRRKLLLKKNAVLSHEIKEIVQALQELEKVYASKASTIAPSKEVSNLTDTVDRQYSVILQLKNEIDDVNNDIAQCKDRIDDTRLRQMQTQRTIKDDEPVLAAITAAAASSSSTTAPEQSSSALSIKTIDAARVSAINTLIDINRELLNGPRSCTIEAIEDPRERLQVQNAVLRRIKTSISDVLPTGPSAKSLAVVGEDESGLPPFAPLAPPPVSEEKVY